jgi:hypothetical protein
MSAEATAVAQKNVVNGWMIQHRRYRFSDKKSVIYSTFYSKALEPHWQAA